MNFDNLVKIASGGTSDIYSFDKNKVVKIVKKEKIIHFKEHEILEKIKHLEGVPKIIKSNETSDLLYIFMEYVEGRELFELYTDSNFYETLKPHFKDIFKQLCDIIKNAHELGIVHADIKHENILISKDFKITLIDWGFSSPFRVQRKGCGTPSYMPPELFADKTYSLPSLDVWSLGVILYSFLFYCLPFDSPDQDDDEIIKNILSYNWDSTRCNQAQLQVFSMIFTEAKMRMSLNELIKTIEKIF